MSRRFAAAVALLFLLAAAGLTAGGALPRVVMVQPVRVVYTLEPTDGLHYVTLIARDDAEARLMVRSLVAEQPHQIVAIELLEGEIGARRDGYLPIPPSPFRLR